MSAFKINLKPLKTLIAKASDAIKKASSTPAASLKTSSISVKNSTKVDPKLQTAMEREHSTSSLSNIPVSIKPSQERLTSDGVAEQQKESDKQKLIQSIDTKTKEGQDQLKKIDDTRLVDSLLPASLPVSEDFSYAAPTFSSAEGSKQIGLKENDLLAEEIPKITSIVFEDVDANGTYDQATLVFKRLYAAVDGKIIFRELYYDIFRKSIFEDKEYTKIGTIKSENFEDHKVYNLSDLLNDDLFGKDDKYLKFTDKDVKDAQIYAYKIQAVYDGNISKLENSNVPTTKTIKLETGATLTTSIPLPERSQKPIVNENAHVNFLDYVKK